MGLPGSSRDDDDDRDHDDVTCDDDDVLCDNKKVSLCVCALLRCNKTARLRYKKRGRVGP